MKDALKALTGGKASFSIRLSIPTQSYSFVDTMSNSKSTDASTEAETRDQSSQCLSFQRAGSWLPISVAAQIEQLASPRDFLKFLGVVQQHEIDVFPITWHPALDTIGEGATAEIRAALIDLQTSYAFKRYIMSDNNEEKLLLHLISEVSILGLESIRNHPNIIKLEGVAWDINNDGQVWPVLVFEKAEHGDLETFFASNPGKDLTFEERLDLCIHIGTALMVLSAHSKSYKFLIQSGQFANNPRKM